MPFTTIKYGEPSSGIPVNFVNEGAGLSQSTVLSDGLDNGIPLGTIANPIFNAEARPSVSTTTQPNYNAISDTTRNVVLLAANANRRSARIVNRSNCVIPVREGGAASPLDYSWLLAPKGEIVLEFPVCTVAIFGYFGTLPDDRIFITERT